MSKELKDFVTLAKWEDRGFYALRMNVEKSHRKVHKMELKVKAVVQQSIAPLFVVINKGFGFDVVK